MCLRSPNWRMTNFSFGNFAAVMNVGQHVCLPRRRGSCLVVLINKCFLSFRLYVCLRSLNWRMTNFSFGNFAAVMNVGQHVCLPRCRGNCLVVLINKCFLSFRLYVCLRSLNWRMTNFSFGNFAAVMNVGQHVCLPRRHGSCLVVLINKSF